MMRALLILLLVGLPMAGERAFSAPAKPPGKDEKLRLAKEVFRIFEAKCADCHGMHLPKPKGKFGYVLDLKRVAANSDYIVRGNARGNRSSTRMVKNDEMPGEDADVPPLTADGKENPGGVECWPGHRMNCPRGFPRQPLRWKRKSEAKVSFLPAGS